MAAAIFQRDAAAQRQRDFPADRQSQAGAVARVAGGERLEQPGRSSSVMPGPLSLMRSSAHGSASARSCTDSAPPGGRVLDGVVQQVARQLAQHPLVRRARRPAPVSMLEVECLSRRSAATGPAPLRARPRARSMRRLSRAAGATARPWPATASGWPAAVARSTVWLISRQRLRGASRRRAAPTAPAP